MPFGLGKSEKRPEDEVAAPEESLEGGEDTPSADPGNGVQDGDPSAAADAGKQYRAPTFRPAFLDKAAPDGGTEAAPPQGDAFFVSVTRDGTAEILRFDDPAEAQSFVEELLDKDVPEEEVAAFSGRRLALKVSRRPVVRLFGEREG